MMATNPNKTFNRYLGFAIPLGIIHRLRGGFWAAKTLKLTVINIPGVGRKIKSCRPAETHKLMLDMLTIGCMK